MSQLIWVHEDMLRDDHPAFAVAPHAAALYVWDDAYMEEMSYGLKRRVFIYETLCEMAVDIVVGDTLEVLRAQLGYDEIVTGKTPNPALKARMDALRATIKVSTQADHAFARLDTPSDLRRFFKYWNKAKKTAFNFDGQP